MQVSRWSQVEQVSVDSQMRSGGGEFIAIAGVGDGFDGFEGEDVLLAFNILRGDLKAVEEEAGAAGVEFRGAERTKNPREGQLDGTAIFEEGKLDRLIFAGHHFL